jgi:hypothetical protein
VTTATTLRVTATTTEHAGRVAIQGGDEREPMLQHDVAGGVGMWRPAQLDESPGHLMGQHADPRPVTQPEGGPAVGSPLELVWYVALFCTDPSTVAAVNGEAGSLLPGANSKVSSRPLRSLVFRVAGLRLAGRGRPVAPAANVPRPRPERPGLLLDFAAGATGRPRLPAVWYSTVACKPRRLDLAHMQARESEPIQITAPAGSVRPVSGEADSALRR